MRFISAGRERDYSFLQRVPCKKGLLAIVLVTIAAFNQTLIRGASAPNSVTGVLTEKSKALEVGTTSLRQDLYGLKPPPKANTKDTKQPRISAPTLYTYSILPPEQINPYVHIDGKAYPLDLVHEDGRPREFQTDEEAHEAARVLSAALPLPKPIIVVGLPKTGTTTIFDFFNNSQYSTSHLLNGKLWIGKCMHDAIRMGRPPLKSCGNNEAWTQIDLTQPGAGGNGCFYPQITYLKELHEEAPQATFVLNRRNYTAWADSVHRWSWDKRLKPNMHIRMAQCKPFGPKSSSKEHLIQWHKDQVQRVRQFVKDHPSHALIEVDIEDPSTGIKMAKAFQTSAAHWGHSNKNG